MSKQHAGNMKCPTGTGNVWKTAGEVLLVAAYWWVKPSKKSPTDKRQQLDGIGGILYLVVIALYLRSIDLRPKGLYVTPYFSGLYRVMALLVSSVVVYSWTWPYFCEICRVITDFVYASCNDWSDDSGDSGKIPDWMVDLPFIGSYRLQDVLASLLFYWVVRDELNNGQENGSGERCDDSRK